MSTGGCRCHPQSRHKKQSENTNSFITTNPNRNFELFKVEVKPHCEYNSDGHAPKTQEYILVARGELTIQLATGKYVLKEGDSIHFDCYLPHILSIIWIRCLNLQILFITYKNSVNIKIGEIK